MTTKQEDRASFIARFVLKIRPKDIEKLDFAYDISKSGHRNQTRENGERYFEHLRATALILVDELGITDVELIISALLHDILEDSFLLSAQRIELICGNRVATIVATISKPRKNDLRFNTQKDRLEFYHQQVRAGSIDAKLVKLADRLHNLRTLSGCSVEKVARKLAETKTEYLPLVDDVATIHTKVGTKLKELFTEAFSKLEATT